MTSVSPIQERTLRGTGVVPGIGYAPAAWKRERVQDLGPTETIAEDAREAEAEKVVSAAGVVGERLEQRAGAATGVASEVLAATASLARDRGWRKTALNLIRKEGVPAARATTTAIDGFVEKFEKLGGLMAERATDLRDVRDRVVAQILGYPEPGVPVPTAPAVLLADDLAPADTAGLDPELIVGLVTTLGGPTSHTAIICRQLGIPCIVAASELSPSSVPQGELVLVDGEAGTLTMGADPEQAKGLVEAEAQRREAIKSWRGPGQTADGEAIQLLANIQDGAGARRAATTQAEGVGLFRTELAFFHADSEPSVDDQAEIYSEIIDAFGERKVVIRTLDAGSDKPLKYASMPDEENPALGVRGIRIAMTRDMGLLTRQLDGIAASIRKAKGEGGSPTVWVMAPMVATVDEAKTFGEACRSRGIVPGIMVEVPAVALLAKQFLQYVDFLSIGTNDLTQYTMAADRMAPQLASLTDPWQPGVLSLVAMTAAAGAEAGKPVGVCGEAAADPLLACVLVGMGVTSLSMAASAIAPVGAKLATVTREQCRAAAEAVKGAEDVAQAKELAAQALAR